MNVIYATDLHGSTLVLEKLLVAAQEFDSDLVLMGGDLTGKRLIPIAETANDCYSATEPYKQKDDSGKTIEIGRTRTVRKSELPEYLKRLEAKGYYWHLGEASELIALNENPEALLQALRDAACKRLLAWAQLVNSRLAEGVMCIWSGGNDDEQIVLNRVAKCANLGRFSYGEGHILTCEKYEILSLGVTNPTPFSTSREVEDRELQVLLETAAKAVRNADTLILNVHAPPLNCGSLDLCLDAEGRSQHVGSASVRSFVENMQPLADFTGHVHEGKGAVSVGRTNIFNPGSDYAAGILQAYTVQFARGAVSGYNHLIR